MALIIPTAFSTYETFADSTSTEGGKLRKYVLAQFRSNANLDWVGVLRARLVKDELKYRDFREVRPRLKKDRELWKKIEMGVGQASVIVIDPEQVYYAVESILESEGAEKDIDFDEKSLIDECATAIIGMTPIAYLPFELTKAVPWSWFDAIQNLEDYLPNKLKKRIGGNLRDA